MRSLVRATRGFLLFFCFCDMMIASPYVAIADEDITVAVSDFTNSTGRFRYDEFEKSIPEMLKTDLSRIGDIVVVERSKLEAILQEQALGQTGIIAIEDAQEVGQLVGAQYVITGEISLVESRLRIDAHIVQSETGKVVGEKVTGPGEHVLEKMVSILANNIAQNLCGSGSYIESERIKNYYPHLVLLAGAASGAITLALHSSYAAHKQDYENATKLDDFDAFYDKANSKYKARNIMFVVTGGLLTTGLSLWLRNSSLNNKIFAASNNDVLNHLAVQPYADPFKSGLGVRICYRW